MGLYWGRPKLLHLEHMQMVRGGAPSQTWGLETTSLEEQIDTDRDSLFAAPTDGHHSPGATGGPFIS